MNWGGYGKATDAEDFAHWAATLYTDQSPWEQSQRIGNVCVIGASLPSCACATMAHSSAIDRERYVDTGLDMLRVCYGRDSRLVAVKVGQP